ncbi:MAG: glycosyltransferase [Ruminococcus flavefaciens]|nr:glycosyltransferase [Ruminococcus flavefaciens]
MEYIRKMVSIVIPVYQARNYIAGCVESILNQTYKNTEMILIDDGSDDGSEVLCDEYACKYNNILCIHQKNRGVSAARNVGIANARGEYILFVDSDDYIEPSYLENAVFYLENEYVDLYLCGYQNVSHNGKQKERKHYPPIKDVILNHDELAGMVMKLFNSRTLHAIGTKVYKKSIIEQYRILFNEKRMYYEDIYFCLNYLRYCNKIYIQKKIMYYYQSDIHNSLSKQKKNYNYVSVYKTYTVLYRLINDHWVNENDKRLFYCSYLERINLCLDSKIQTEGRYTVNIHKLYKMLSQDYFYKAVAIYVNKAERAEYFCVRKKFLFLAYLIRKYWLYEQ